jgi:hypothetical protein
MKIVNYINCYFAFNCLQFARIQKYGEDSGNTCSTLFGCCPRMVDTVDYLGGHSDGSSTWPSKQINNSPSLLFSRPAECQN